MTAYIKSTDFAVKDVLLTGNPNKLVKGSEVDVEFNNIALADTTNVKQTSNVGSAIIPAGATTQRDIFPSVGYQRFNTTTQMLEVYGSSGWQGGGGSTCTVEVQTSTASQTVFILSNSYVPSTNTIQVFVDGLLKLPTSYTETSANIITFIAGLTLGSKVEFVVFGRSIGAVDAVNASYLPAGTGAVATTVADDLNEFLHANNFTGVDPTGAADSLTGLQAAIDAGVLAGKRVIGRGNYKISGKLVFKGDADFSQANINVTGAPAIALEVSTGNASNPTTQLFNATIWLPKTVTNVAKPGTGWAGQGIGVRTVNCYSCRVFFGDIISFAKTIQLTSYGTGNTYNDYFLGHLENGQVNIDLSPGDAGAWVNENSFYGGRFSHYSGEGTNVTGTRHIYISNGIGNVPNNNIFYKPSIEGDTAEFHAEVGGSFITLMQARWEATTPKLRYFGTTTNHGTRNVVLGGYGAQNVVVSVSGTTGGNNTVDFPGGGLASVNTTIGLQNQTSSGNAIHKYYEAGTLPETAGASDWSYQAASQYLSGKRKADVAERIKLDFVNGRLYLGAGTGAATQYLGYSGGSWLFGGSVLDVSPGVTNVTDLGESGLRFKKLFMSGGISAFGATPPATQPTVTGSRGGNAALASLLTTIAATGLIIDGTTA